LKKALAANVSKTYFMAAASHDIKQPLYALGMLTDTLLMSGPGASAVPVLKGLRGSIDEMSEHFDTLLDFGKFQDGSFEVQPATFRLGAFSERLDFEIAPLCSSKGLTWNIDMDDVTVWTDQELFLRLCRNLLTNAVNYTHSGEVCCYAKANVDAVEFLISDTGIGIEAEKQREVFERFVQVERSGIGAAGTGLGLSIVEKIGEALHLGLQMSSALGKGTEFRFRLLRVPPK
jgi:signal transduction histidine kinase